MKIRTKYAPYPGSNVGQILARGLGRRTSKRYDQALNTEANHRAGAERLATRLGLTLTAADPTFVGEWRVFTTTEE